MMCSICSSSSSMDCILPRNGPNPTLMDPDYGQVFHHGSFSALLRSGVIGPTEAHSAVARETAKQRTRGGEETTLTSIDSGTLGWICRSDVMRRCISRIADTNKHLL